MNTAGNPFASPSLEPQATEKIPEERKARRIPKYVGSGTRFANLFIDNIAVNGLSFGFGIFAGKLLVANGAQFRPDGRLNLSLGAEFALSLVALPIAFAYYLFMESAYGQTLGKMVTQTRVVDINGRPPDFLTVLGRTLARCIPLDAFSFLGEVPRGWHDTLSGTYVVSTRRPPRHAKIDLPDLGPLRDS